jgi:tRNA pseudouridine38-40 synthase
LLARRVDWYHQLLDIVAMRDAARLLLGTHDFSAFRAAECQARSPVKTLELIHVRQRGTLIEVRLQAPSFLHHQVRNIVGTLKLVGEGKAPVDHVRAVLAARNRAGAGQTAPPEGLYLEGIEYRDETIR